MRNITLKQLRVVKALAETAKVIGAAELLSVTPPAVTLRLKELEESAGLPLFERLKAGMSLTAAGRHVLDAANRIEAVLSSCAEQLDAMRGLKAGGVSIGVVSTARYFAPAALGAFRRNHPNIEIRLFVGNREDTIRGLAALDFDLVIMGRPPDGLEVESRVIGDHPHVIVAPPGHALALKRRTEIRALAAETFLMREKGSGTRGLMERLFDENNVSPRMGMEVDSNETIKQAVMAGLGVAFISAHTVAAEVETKRLVVLDVVGLPALRQWWIVRHAGKRTMPAAEALWIFLEQEGQAFLPALPIDLCENRVAGRPNKKRKVSR